MPDYILNDSKGLSNSNLTLANAGVENVLSSSTGISKSLLDQIDLQEYDVIQGKKFIGSDGKLHTGTLEDQPNDMQCPVVTQYDPGTGFTYLALPAGAYRRTDGRMSPHPNIKRRLMEIVGEAGFNKGAWSTTINPGGSVTIPKGFHNGSGKVTASDSARNVVTLVNSTGRVASSFWSLNYSRAFSGYHSFVVAVVARNLNPLYNTTLSASSGSVSSAYLQAIAMEDDNTYLHAKLFTVSNANVSSTTLTIRGSDGSGWGYIIYGIT